MQNSLVDSPTLFELRPDLGAPTPDWAYVKSHLPPFDSIDTELDLAGTLRVMTTEGNLGHSCVLVLCLHHRHHGAPLPKRRVLTPLFAF